MRIRPFTDSDWPSVWPVILPFIRAGETYAFPRDMDEASARDYWLDPDHRVFVAELENGRLGGTYYLRTNQQGGGDHVCNGGYMTSAALHGRGIARAMAEHSFETARALGYRAMQFNFVVSSNERAVRLWQTLGFEIVGRLPDAFRHPTLGYVDALVMWQSLCKEDDKRLPTPA